MRRRTWGLAGAAALATVAGVVAGTSGAEPAAPAAAPPSTAQVVRGELFTTLSVNGTLGYRGRSSAINQARGIYTQLPEAGDSVDCGEVLYRVDEHAVRLLCGTVPAYRTLRSGRKGKDVRQLNRNLHALGYDVDPRDDAFTKRTKTALERLQHDATLDMDDAVVLPRAARIAAVTPKLGERARPGAEVVVASSATLEVQVDLEPSQRGEVKRGDRARITLPGNTTTEGTVDRLGKVVRTAGDDGTGAATIPAYVSLDDPADARGLDQAPVRVQVTTQGVASALSVPVTALVGRTGGGFAVERVHGDGRRELVGVELGLFDTANGRVEIAGALRAGDRVVVPSP